MEGKSSSGPLTFGFDIGIASVGWCVLGETRIVDLGVRCFDKAETAKEGESLNLARRTARLMRRRLRRRAWRLTKLSRLLRRTGLIADVRDIRKTPTKSPWRLRVDGLDRRLDQEEWARVIFHLCKHRGFHWISRAEEKKAEGDAKSEGGRVKKGLADTQRRMAEKGYRSAAEMVLAEFPDAQRNKQGDYGKALSRRLLGEELTLLFQRQRDLGNQHASAELEAEVLGDGHKKGLFWEQKPPLAGADLLKMLGKCTFEKQEYRAPKASFTAERHVWLTRLNNLRIVFDGTTRPLNESERRIALPLPYKQASDLTYKQLRSALTKAGMLPDDFKFAGLNYPAAAQADGGKSKDPESERLIKLPAWQEMRKALKEHGLETEWEGMAGAATGGDPTLLDEIARVLSVFKDGEEVTLELRKLPLSGGEKMIMALSELSFDKFHALSIKALRKIVPHMEAGMRYDEAVAAISEYGHHSQLQKPDAEKERYLPPLYESQRGSDHGEFGKMIFSKRIDSEIPGGIPRNPVVLRSLNQARKVLNALVKTYGSPVAVHIEMARDLSRPLDERKKIKDAQDEYKKRNDEDKARFAEEHGMPAKSREFEKFQLYREQHGKCAYSLKELDLHRVLHEIGYAEVDHAIPYSRSFDDSKNNKVLVLTEENRNKGNRTPYEYLTSFAGGEHGERWINFASFVESNRSYRLAKKTRLRRKDFEKAAEEFRDRNLNDTRYICRFFKNYVERYLQLDASPDGTTAKRCVVLNGQTTAFLRARWGLLKMRGDNDRHHALDAAVVAACSHSMVKRLSDYARTKELAKVRDGFPDPQTGEILDPVKFQQLQVHFPDPWPNFRAELETRLHVDDRTELHAKLENFGTYTAEALNAVRPLFVSRAPQRRNGGAFHKETIYGKNRELDLALKTVVQRIDVMDIQEKHLSQIVGAHDKRNLGLIIALRQWIARRTEAESIEASLGKGKNKRKPTPEEEARLKSLRTLPKKPINEPLNDNPKKKSNPIKKVSIVVTQKSGVYIRNGVAEPGKVQYTKLYRHNGEYYFQPCYALPNENTFGNLSIPADAKDTGYRLYDNDVIQIAHPALAQCYKEMRRHVADTGEILIDVKLAFPKGYFLGYWAYFEPSNNRPVVQMHDSACFFLLEAGKQADKATFTLIAKEKRNKKEGSTNKEYEYFEYGPPSDRKPLCFALERDIKRQIGTATFFEKLHVDRLGNLYPSSQETRRGLA